ncbi:MAG: CPBP family intramembrane metalloprotease [Firmicutes bacterium]|nr:CPBP family intramembrane metalloprotease [Bacillota bacterium]
MNVLVNEFIKLIINLILFSFIPLIWYLVKEKKLKGFINSLGIYIPSKINYSELFIPILVVYIIILVANITVILLGYSGRSSLDTQDITVFTLFLYLLLYGLKTGLAEEIFFRGFIAKKLIKKIGFLKGNIIQAVIFALPHFVMEGKASQVDIVVRIINAFLLGYIFGYVMHKKSDGSIIPIIIAHIIINMVSSYILFLIL